MDGLWRDGLWEDSESPTDRSGTAAVMAIPAQYQGVVLLQYRVAMYRVAMYRVAMYRVAPPEKA